MLAFITSVIASLLEKVGLRWLVHHEAEKKAKDIANAPVTKDEEIKYFE